MSHEQSPFFGASRPGSAASSSTRLQMHCTFGWYSICLWEATYYFLLLFFLSSRYAHIVTTHMYTYTLCTLFYYFVVEHVFFALKPPFKCHLFHQWDRSHQTLKFSAVETVETSMLQPSDSLRWSGTAEVQSWSYRRCFREKWVKRFDTRSTRYVHADWCNKWICWLNVTWDLRNHTFFGESIPSRGSIFSRRFRPWRLGDMI